MIVLIFETSLRDEAFRDEYADMNRRTRSAAERIPGFVSWKEYAGPSGVTLGVIEFESEDALVAWRDEPTHAEVNRRGREAVYGRYRVRVCNVLRESAFDSAEAAAG